MVRRVDVDEGISVAQYMIGFPAIEEPKVVITLYLAVELREDLLLDDV